MKPLPATSAYVGPPWLESITRFIAGQFQSIRDFGCEIKLDDEGRVRDRETRPHAIVQAGIAVRSVVARGVSEDAFDVMDTGR